MRQSSDIKGITRERLPDALIQSYREGGSLDWQAQAQIIEILLGLDRDLLASALRTAPANLANTGTSFCPLQCLKIALREGLPSDSALGKSLASDDHSYTDKIRRLVTTIDNIAGFTRRDQKALSDIMSKFNSDWIARVAVVAEFQNILASHRQEIERVHHDLCLGIPDYWAGDDAGVGRSIYRVATAIHGSEELGRRALSRYGCDQADSRARYRTDTVRS